MLLFVGCPNGKGDNYAPQAFGDRQICDDSKGGHPLRWGIFDEYVRF